MARAVDSESTTVTSSPIFGKPVEKYYRMMSCMEHNRTTEHAAKNEQQQQFQRKLENIWYSYTYLYQRGSESPPGEGKGSVEVKPE